MDAISPLVSPEVGERSHSPTESLKPTAMHPLSKLPSRAVTAWNDFWLAATSAAVFVLIRTALGLIGLLWFASLLPDLDAFFGDQALVRGAEYKGRFWGLFRWIPVETWMGPLVIVSILASAGLVAGKFVRASAVVMAVSLLSITREANIFWNSGDELFRIMLILFAAACLIAGPASSTPLLGTPTHHSTSGSRSWPKMPSLHLRLFQIQLSVIYLATVIEKVPGAPWREGTAAAMALKLEDLQRFWVPEFVTESARVANAMTWGTLALEVSLPFLLWNRRARPFAVIAGVSMHLIMDYTLIVGVFSYAMWTLYLSFVPDSTAERFLTWVASFLRRLMAAR